MEVILLSDVDNVGLRGEVVNVARGYARNFLLPRRLAEAATPEKIAEVQKRETQRARHEARTVEQAQQIAEELTATELRFEVKAGPTGSLCGSVTATDIADELWRAKKIRVDRRKIDLDTIKRIGRYEIPQAAQPVSEGDLEAVLAEEATASEPEATQAPEPEPETETETA